MDELLEFIDMVFISISGNVCGEHSITMEDLKHLELLTQTAIKSREN